MSPQPIQFDSTHLDLSPRVFRDTSVDASPAAGSETTIAHVTLANDLAIVSGVLVVAFAAFTVGTNGVTATLKIRQTDTSGSTVASTGATTVVAADLHELSIAGFDVSPLSNSGVYVLTLTIGSGSAPSTVSGVTLAAIVA